MTKNSLKNMETGFKVPKDYFENFEDRLLSELKLKETASHSGFKLPEDYFDSLDNKILDAVKKSNNTKVIPFLSIRKIAYATAVAASLILIYTIYFNNNESLTINNIETVSIENYILTEGLETSDIASLFSDEDLSEITSVKNNLSSETLENYVLENLDIDELITNNN